MVYYTFYTMQSHQNIYQNQVRYNPYRQTHIKKDLHHRQDYIIRFCSSNIIFASSSTSVISIAYKGAYNVGP